MGCFWIGINHTSHGVLKVDPKKRLLLELISGILVIISWLVIIPGLVLVATSGKTLRELDDNILQYYGVLCFMFGNGFYLLATLFYSILNMCFRKDILLRKTTVGRTSFYGRRQLEGHPSTKDDSWKVILNLCFRKDILLRKTTVGRSEWKEREKQEFCFDICNPLNGLRVFHHLEHRGAVLINLIVVVCSAIELSSSTQNMYPWSSDDTNLLSTLLGFSSFILVLALIQTFLSYFYAEDVALCGVSICCVNFWFIRRYPQEVCDVALAEANEENPAKVGKYNQFQNEKEDISPPPYSQVMPQV